MDIKEIIYKPYPLLGIKFEYGGRGPLAFDCWGLEMEVFKRFGIIIPDYELCGDIPDVINEKMENSRWEWERSDGSVIPSLMPIRFHSVEYKNHVGVYIGDGKFIHTRNKVGVCIDSITSPAWRNKIEGYYIYKGGTACGGKN